MRSPSQHERVLPALLDRLTDDARLLTEVQLRTSRELLAERGLTLEDVIRSMQRAGFSAVDSGSGHGTPEAGAGSECTLRFLGRPGAAHGVGPRRVMLRSAEGGPGVELYTCCDVTVARIANLEGRGDSTETVSMRELRRIVQRDLDWLLNAGSLEPGTDLQRYPEVRRSVLNFGMPLLSGVSGGTLDTARLAAQIQEALQRFEPRLSQIRVTPLPAEDGDAQPEFRIDAELWGTPVSQAWSARTRIELSTGSVHIEEAGGG